jgi:PAS domain S-box-containing protein
LKSLTEHTNSTPQLQDFLDGRILDLPDRLLDLLPIGVYVCDRAGLIVRYNRTAAELWGCSPKLGDPTARFCGSYRLYRLNGDPMPHAKCPMADVLMTGHGLRDQQVLIEREDGTRIVALVNIEAIKDDTRRVIGAVNVFRHKPELGCDPIHLNAAARASDALLQGLPTAVYTTDPAGLITFYNEAAAELWGVRPELGKSRFNGAWKIYWPDGTPLSHEESPMALSLKEKRPIRGMEAIAERPDGTRVPFISYPMPLFDSSGALTGAVNTLVDITERHEAEQAAQRLASIVESSDDAVLARDLDGLLTSWNHGAERLFGYKADEVIGKPVTILIPAGREDEEPFMLARIRRGERVDHYETVRRRKDGCLIEISLSISPIKAADGRIVGASKIARDITERKRAEAALRESEERFRGIFENAGTGIAIADLEGRFQSYNPAYAAMLGYSEQELRSLICVDLMHPEDREANLAEKRRLLALEISSFQIVNRYIGKGGKLIWVHKHVSLLCDAAGRPTNTVVLATDITERKRQDDHIRLLMREVNHRSKNLLTVVQAIARQTAAATPIDFAARFEQRIQALCASQDVLVGNDWRGAKLDELVRSQLAHFEDLIGTRIILEGPPLLVTASASQALGMALHELATNAGKYGALANGDGRVAIKWALEGESVSAQTFVMSWREQGKSPIEAPSKRGFGSTVICKMAELSLTAKVDLEFPAPGLSWRLQCPADQVLQEANAPLMPQPVTSPWVRQRVRRS